MKKEATNGIEFEEQQLEQETKAPVKKQSLYNIQENYQELMIAAEEAEGILTPELEEALLINEKQLKVKSIGYLEVIKTKEAFNLLLDNEIKRLQGMKKTNDNLIKTLQNSLLNAVKLFGEFKVGTLTFTTRKSSSVLISDEDKIDKKYKVIKVTEIINKVEIKKDIKNGTIIPGAEIQENLNLRIK